MVYPLSLIVPVLNEKKYITEFLHQFASQLNFSRHFRIVVVDNGSTDGTMMLIQQFRKSHRNMNIVLLREKKLGVIYATKTGFDAALGSSVLVRLDADTRVQPTFLHDVWREMERGDSDAICGKFVFPWDIYLDWLPYQSHIYTLVVKKRNKITDIARYWSGPLLNGPFYAVTRKAYEGSGGINLKSNILRYNDDVEFGIRLVLAGYKIRNTTITVTISPRRLKQNFEVYITGELYWSESDDESAKSVNSSNNVISKTDILKRLVKTASEFYIRVAAYQLSYKAKPKQLRRFFSDIGTSYRKHAYLSGKSEAHCLDHLQNDLRDPLMKYFYEKIR